jgi:SAM-dependent methyltransferase
MHVDALSAWDAELRAWAIPDEIIAAAPVSPYGFGVALFDRRAEEAMRRRTPSQARAAEALPDGGTVLDVGCGGGAAAMPLAGRAGRLIGVDQQTSMLEAFAARADALGVAHEEIEGTWPEVADATPEADVVVCHHVLYNVAALAPFARALTDHARRRVVAEISAEHPLAWMRPLWKRFHDLERPDGPTSGTAIAALGGLGYDVEAETREETSPWDAGDELVGFCRTRLCLAADRDDEVAEALRDAGLPRPGRRLVTLWWEPPRSPPARG